MAVATAQMFFSYGAMSATSLLRAVNEQEYFATLMCATIVMPIIAFLVLRLKHVEVLKMKLDPAVVAVPKDDTKEKPYKKYCSYQQLFHACFKSYSNRVGQFQCLQITP